METKRKSIRNKVFCVLLAAVCTVCTAGIAERHTEIRYQLSEVFGSQTVTIDIYEQEETIAVSSLFPDKAAVFSRDMSAFTNRITDSIIALNEKNISGLYEKTEQMILSWIDMQPYEKHTGHYFGELFQSADSMKSYEFTLSSFTEYLNTITDGKNAELYKLFSMLLQQIISYFNAENSSEILIRASNYNNGCYYSFVFLRESSIIFTISADFSSTQQRHIVAGYKIAGKQYYRDMDLDFSQNGQFVLTYRFFSGSGSYRNTVKDKKPLFTEKTAVFRNNENNICINTVMESGILSDSLCCDTVFCPGTNGECTIFQKIYIQNEPEKNIYISAAAEPTLRQVTFTDKTKKYLSDKDEKEEIREAVYTAVIQLAAEMMPIIPEEYRTILFKLLID